MTDQTRALYERAITAYGEGHQMVKAMEELGELTQAIAKYTNMPAIPGSDAETEALRAARDHVAEEIADVGIMLDQIGMLLGIGSAAARWRWKKLMRLRQRLEDECDEHV